MLIQNKRYFKLKMKLLIAYFNRIINFLSGTYVNIYQYLRLYNFFLKYLITFKNFSIQLNTPSLL